MVRLVFQRGVFNAAQTHLVATALFWFAFSLPFNGLFLLLTRTFFSLQRPWVPTTIAAINLVLTAGAAAALYHLGLGGVVAATAIATAASVVAQIVILRRLLGRLELGRLIWTTGRVVLASAALAGVSYGVWHVLDSAVGRGLGGQIVSLGFGLGTGLAVYITAVNLLRIPEAQQVWRLLRRAGARVQ
jgi:putative peptidoglycan lipid II flippase